MTVVAVLFTDETPLVVSDALVSAKIAAPTGAASPLLPTADQRPGFGSFQPVGLARKYWILPNKTFFFYAGDIAIARRAFDRLSRRVVDGETLTRQVVVAERDTACEGNRDFSCILISSPDDDGVCEYLPVGHVAEGVIEGYGYVLAIGSGSEPLMDLLRRHPGPSSEDAEARVLAALNAAALATLEYQDPESALSKKSSGGYFEVTNPFFFEKSWMHLVRGSAHLFVDVVDRCAVLTQLAVSKQDDRSTVTVFGHGLLEPIEDGSVQINAAWLQTSVLSDMRDDAPPQPYVGPPPIAHLSSLSVYGKRQLACGHTVYAKTVACDVGAPVGVLLECDDEIFNEGDVADLLLTLNPRPMESLCQRLRAAECPRCDAPRSAVEVAT